MLVKRTGENKKGDATRKDAERTKATAVLHRLPAVAAVIVATAAIVTAAMVTIAIVVAVRKEEEGRRPGRRNRKEREIRKKKGVMHERKLFQTIMIATRRGFLNRFSLVAIIYTWGINTAMRIRWSTHILEIR